MPFTHVFPRLGSLSIIFLNRNNLELLPIAYNGTALSTTYVPIIRAIVDSSYVANAANVPIGWQLQVATPSNTNVVHNFYANGILVHNKPVPTICCTNSTGAIVYVALRDCCCNDRPGEPHWVPCPVNPGP